MSFQYPETHTRLQARGIINLQDRCSTSIMDMRTSKIGGTSATTTAPTTNSATNTNATWRVEKKRMEYHRSLSQGNARRLFSASHFSVVSLLLLVGLTISLLILPLILPPLPPPPLMLLMLPILILALLMILAFMPSNARDITYTYV